MVGAPVVRWSRRLGRRERPVLTSSRSFFLAFAAGTSPAESLVDSGAEPRARIHAGETVMRHRGTGCIHAGRSVDAAARVR